MVNLPSLLINAMGGGRSEEESSPSQAQQQQPPPASTAAVDISSIHSNIHDGNENNDAQVQLALQLPIDTTENDVGGLPVLTANDHQDGTTAATSTTTNSNAGFMSSSPPEQEQQLQQQHDLTSMLPQPPSLSGIEGQQQQQLQPGATTTPTAAVTMDSGTPIATASGVGPPETLLTGTLVSSSLKRPPPHSTSTAPVGKKQKGSGSGGAAGTNSASSKRRRSTGNAPNHNTSKSGGGGGHSHKKKQGGHHHHNGHSSSSSAANEVWNAMLFELLKFRAKKGHCNVPKTGALGRWVAKQRLLKPKIPEEDGEDPHPHHENHVAAATTENVPSTTTTNVVVAATTDHGGATVPVATAAATEEPSAMKDLTPSASIPNDGTTTTQMTATAIKTEPVASSETTKHFLTPDKVEVLESIGFVWDPVQADYDDKWKRRFEELVDFVQVNGHFSVSQSTPLGKWIKIQRENKKEADLKKAGMLPVRAKQRPCLSQERIQKLEGIGFQWKVKKPPIGWERRYQQLLEYKNTHGHCNVPQSYPPDRPFGRWVMKQRCEYSLKVRGEKSQLRDDREERLNALGFSWVAPCVRKKTFVTTAGGEEVEIDVDVPPSHGVDENDNEEEEEEEEEEAGVNDHHHHHPMIVDTTGHSSHNSSNILDHVHHQQHHLNHAAHHAPQPPPPQQPTSMLPPPPGEGTKDVRMTTGMPEWAV